MSTQYEITVKRTRPPSATDAAFDAHRWEAIYTQTVEDLDLKAVIAAVNSTNQTALERELAAKQARGLNQP